MRVTLLKPFENIMNGRRGAAITPGNSVNRFTLCVPRRDIYVGESQAEARAVLQHALSQGYRGIPPEALITGSVDEVTEKFRPFGEIGYTEILVRHLTNDQPKVLGSLERLAAVRAARA